MTLSEGGYEFDTEILERLLKTPDGEMNADHFGVIFHECFPAASYKEGAYFLPIVLDFLRSNPQEGCPCIAGVVWFLREYMSELEQDELATDCQNAIVECFRIWTSEFRVIHFDRQMCEQNEMDCSHFDRVQNGKAVCALIDQLVRSSVYIDLAETLISSLAYQTDNDIYSAWYLEYAKVIKQRNAILGPSFQSMFADSKAGKLFAIAQQRIAESFIIVQSTTTPEGNVTQRIDKQSDEGQMLLSSAGHVPPSNLPTMLNPISTSTVIGDLTSNSGLFQQHHDRILESPIARESSPTYWQELRNQLGILPHD